MLRTSLVLAALLALVFSTSAFAQRGPQGPWKQRQHFGQHHGKKSHYMKWWKGLPQTTRDKIKALKLEKMRTVLPLKAELKLLGAQLKVELTSDSASMVKIKKLIARKVALKKQKMLAKVNHKLAVQKLLSGKDLVFYRLMLLKGKKGHQRRGPRHGFGRR